MEGGSDAAALREPLARGDDRGARSDDDLDLLLVESTEEASADAGRQPRRSADGVWLEGAKLFALTVNYIFGAGVLGVPYAIAHGGIVVSSFTLIVSSGFGLLAMVWLLECHERARAIKGSDSLVEYSEMCRMFLGTRAQRVLEVSLTIYVICSSWMYGAIFSVSVGKTLPITANASQCDLSSVSGPLWNAPHVDCWIDYLIYLAIFTGIMSVLVRTDIADMTQIQMGLTAVGLLALFVMVATVLAAIPEDHIAELDSETIYFNPTGFGGVFGTFIFAQLCHLGIPLLSTIPARKEILRPVFVGVISTTTSLYLMLGIICAVFFGVSASADNPKAVNKLITLDWQEYTAGKFEAGFFAKLVSYFVRLYPAVTVGAAFPLYAITMGNSWYLTLNGDDGQQGDGDAPPGKKNRYYIAAMLPSVLLAAFMADISFMLLFVGVSGFVIAFFLPPLMQLASCKQHPAYAKTRYSSTFSSRPFCFACLVFASVALVYTFVAQFTD